MTLTIKYRTARSLVPAAVALAGLLLTAACVSPSTGGNHDVPSPPPSTRR